MKLLLILVDCIVYPADHWHMFLSNLCWTYIFFYICVVVVLCLSTTCSTTVHIHNPTQPNNRLCTSLHQTQTPNKTTCTQHETKRTMRVVTRKRWSTIRRRARLIVLCMREICLSSRTSTRCPFSRRPRRGSTSQTAWFPERYNINFDIWLKFNLIICFQFQQKPSSSFPPPSPQQFYKNVSDSPVSSWVYIISNIKHLLGQHDGWHDRYDPPEPLV